jgi:GH15 family glucan-1,4-alpha-glucosidase
VNVDPSRPIADYALLSDCHSTALVSSDGAIEWACLRRFDSASVFARLLDIGGGVFSIRPAGEIIDRHRRYVPGTMVLQTTLRTETGSIRLTDAFAMRRGGATEPRHQLLREIEVLAGEVDLEVVIEPRFDYGRSHPWIRRHDASTFSAVAGDEAIVIGTDLELGIDPDELRLTGRIPLIAGQKRVVTLVSRPAHLLDAQVAEPGDVHGLIAETTDWWATWSARTVAQGRYRELTERSALVLKSLCCAATGAIVAAPTTSLPEIPGGAANWDYRYCWVRDATMALQALADVGHIEVAQGFRDFIMRSAAGRGDELQIMYGPYGERRLTEVELDLAGWRGSRPVRIGNGAASQTQLDVYGHLLDAAHLWHDRIRSIDDDEWSFLRSVVDQAAKHRHTRDAGIWELRGASQHYVHSKVMLWLALDRGVRLVEDFGLDPSRSDVEGWRTVRDGVRADVERLGVDHRHGHFVQHYDSTTVDASLLKLPLVGFVDANDPRMVRTVQAIQRDLAVGTDGFLRRFSGDHNGVVTHGPEGVFLLCTFWLVEVLALQGRQDEAEALFERLVALGNDVGLFAEEYDIMATEFLGNFPQAFTHLGLIAAAKRLREGQEAVGT